MAEFGIFAGAVPVTDSIFKHVGEIVKFWKDVKHAPAKIEDLLEELETHSELLKYWTTSPHASSFQSSPGFAKCHKSCLRVQCLLKEVALKFRSKGMRRLRVEATWTAMKAVFNSGEIDDLIARMTRADQKLLMAIECYKQ